MTHRRFDDRVAVITGSGRGLGFAYAQLLAGLGAKVVINDNGSFMFGNHRFRSHGDTGLGPVDMVKSIVLSSNVYYYSLANEMGVDLMHEQLSPLHGRGA